LYLWHSEGLVHPAGQFTYLNPYPKYEQLGYRFPDFSDRLSKEWYKEILEILYFEDYDDPTVDKARKSCKVHKMVEISRKGF
jgi:hypothetical protein